MGPFMELCMPVHALTLSYRCWQCCEHAAILGNVLVNGNNYIVSALPGLQFSEKLFLPHVTHYFSHRIVWG